MPSLLRWAVPLILLYGIWAYLLPMVGINPATSLILAAMFTLGAVVLVGRFFPAFALPIPMLSRIKPMWAAVLILIPVLTLGMFGLPRLIPNFFAGQISGPIAAVAPVQIVTADVCKSSVNPELLGSAATLYINAWDMESNTPYSVAVDLTTYCYVYRNGNSADNFVTATTDTSAATIAGFSVGDTVYIYCGGSSYYTELFSMCIDSATPAVNLVSHTASATTDLQIVGYDSSGSAALTAGTSSMQDYNMTLGASQEDVFYLKLTNNVANKAFQFDGWAVAKFTNIDECRPTSTEGRSFTKSASVTFLESQAINVSSGTYNNPITKDYVPYVVSSPVLLREWEWIKDKFTIKATSTDPTGGTNSTTFNGVAAVAFDVTYAKGDDGGAHFDFYSHDSGESNVGISETLTSPLGKDNGVLICAV